MRADFGDALKHLQEEKALARADSSEERDRILRKRHLRESWQDFVDNVKIGVVVVIFAFLLLKTFCIL